MAKHTYDDLQTLNIKFKVADDLTSERQAQYQEIILDALGHYGSEMAMTNPEAYEMIYKLLNDWDV